LAGLLGLNRATISTAYELLEADRLISGQVGRGSFVRAEGEADAGFTWEQWDAQESRPGAVRAGSPAGQAQIGEVEISFAVSRPSRDLFPLDDFRASCAAVLARPDLADILQLGCPGGYEPLRRLLLEQARHEQLASHSDDLLITNGCQQALDLIGRVLVRPGDTVAVEDPVYPGLHRLLTGLGARLAGIPVGPDGLDLAVLERALRAAGAAKPRLLVVTSNFQNPTGATLPLAGRRAVLEIARAAGIPVVENDAYGELRYSGEPLPALKQLDEAGGTVLLRSFSKISFPGLRVGWILGPKALIERLRQAKEAADLHTDQLSQAVLLEFVETGRLDAHRARVLRAGAERLAATLEGCRRYMPAGTRFTRPEGGMNVWLQLPDRMDAAELLPRARKEGVGYLPGSYFTIARPDPCALRLSFASLTPEQIGRGLELLGRVAAAETERAAAVFEPASAMV
jgi:2-aminoadipate transaminase